MTDELAGKVALVTGASRGIGKSIAVALAAAGADVAVNYRNREAAARATCAEIEALGRRAIPVAADVSVAAQVGQLVDSVARELGPVSVLVNNAGITRPQPIDQITEQSWDEVLAINLKSVFLVTQAVLPQMRAARWGRIVNISTGAAKYPAAMRVLSGPPRAALANYCHAISKELATLMGGTIGLESEEGRGTTVRVSLPAAE